MFCHVMQLVWITFSFKAQEFAWKSTHTYTYIFRHFNVKQLLKYYSNSLEQTPNMLPDYALNYN